MFHVVVIYVDLYFVRMNIASGDSSMTNWGEFGMTYFLESWNLTGTSSLFYSCSTASNIIIVIGSEKKKEMSAKRNRKIAQN